MKIGIFLILFTILYWYFAPKFVQADENWTPEFKEFCEKYMPYVNKYKGINAGCCDINHPSNDILKAGWKGETLLICDGKEIL
tara:strand:+ start:147 stop:395 length:249 start_codon:yes stop_codon:yes gene_type:complete